MSLALQKRVQAVELQLAELERRVAALEAARSEKPAAKAPKVDPARERPSLGLG